MNRKLIPARWLALLFATAALVALCILYVDHPLADFVEDHLRHRPFFNAAVVILRPLPALAVLALGFLLVDGLRTVAGSPPALWSRTPVIASWAACWGLATTVVLKRVFGRSDAYPTWALSHVDRWLFLWGHEGYESFPSGTMTVGTAVLAVLWIRSPALRPLWMALLLLAVVLLVVTDSHWIADIIAGTFLGATIGWLTTVLHPAAAPRGDAA